MELFALVQREKICVLGYECCCCVYEIGVCLDDSVIWKGCILYVVCEKDFLLGLYVEGGSVSLLIP